METRIGLDCEIQPDLGLFCLNAGPSPPAPLGNWLPQFQLAAYQISGFVRVAPRLANGAPAPGTVFRLNFSFRLPTE